MAHFTLCECIEFSFLHSCDLITPEWHWNRCCVMCQYSVADLPGGFFGWDMCLSFPFYWPAHIESTRRWFNEQADCCSVERLLLYKLKRHWVTWKVLYCGSFIEEICSWGGHREIGDLDWLLHILFINKYLAFWSIFFLVHDFYSPAFFLWELQLHIKV